MIWDVITRAFEKLKTPASPAYPLPGVEFHSRLATATRANDRGGRPWSKVTGITLHQTACVLGERPARWDTLGAHVGVTRAGKVIHVHEFNRIVWHGNGFNSQCIGVEMDGLYAGVDGDPSTVWDNPATTQHETGMAVTPELVEAALDTIRWICAEVSRHGGKVKVLVAHRQSSATRRNDPGSAIWTRVALPLHAELKLSDGGPGFKIGDGYAIPEAWDPSRVGVRY